MARLISALPVPTHVRQAARRLRARATERLLMSGLRAFSRLPLDDALERAERMGAIAYRYMRKPRRRALAHLEAAFGSSLPPSAREHLARASFINAARSFCEIAKIDEVRERRELYIDVEGSAYLEALAQERGLLVVTGQIGNWELLSSYWSWSGRDVTVLSRRVRNVPLHELVVRFRAREGIDTLTPESPGVKSRIARAIESDGLLACLVDTETKATSIPIPFFGRLARPTMAAASLAVRYDLPIAVMFIKRRAQGGQRIVVGRPLEVERRGDAATDIKALTKALNDRIEEQIHRNPAEWLWWHRELRR